MTNSSESRLRASELFHTPILTASLFCFLALFLLEGVAVATVRDPAVKFRVVGAAPKAEVGTSQVLQLRVESAEPAFVSDVTLEGKGWLVRAVSAPRTVTLDPGATRDLCAVINALDPRSPLIRR